MKPAHIVGFAHVLAQFVPIYAAGDGTMPVAQPAQDPAPVSQDYLELDFTRSELAKPDPSVYSRLFHSPQGFVQTDLSAQSESSVHTELLSTPEHYAPALHTVVTTKATSINSTYASPEIAVISPVYDNSADATLDDLFDALEAHAMERQHQARLEVETQLKDQQTPEHVHDHPEFQGPLAPASDQSGVKPLQSSLQKSPLIPQQPPLEQLPVPNPLEEDLPYQYELTRPLREELGKLPQQVDHSAVNEVTVQTIAGQDDDLNRIIAPVQYEMAGATGQLLYATTSVLQTEHELTGASYLTFDWIQENWSYSHSADPSLGPASANSAGKLGFHLLALALNLI